LGEIGAELITRLDTNFSRLGGVPPFGITVSGLGAFPSLARASVLWLGVSEGAEALTKLAAFAERLAVKAGCAAERRKFHPHMSLARARGGPLDAGSPPFVPPGKYSWTCREFTLMKSELTPSGPVYSPLRGYSLG
jgi:2'-5' RNA ligase